jgi:hypothetical protein
MKAFRLVTVKQAAGRVKEKAVVLAPTSWKSPPLKLIFAQLLKKLPALTEPEGTLRSSQGRHCSLS